MDPNSPHNTSPYNNPPQQPNPYVPPQPQTSGGSMFATPGTVPTQAAPVPAVDYSQPVAYDRDGNPLYAHPPTAPATYTPPVTAPQPTSIPPHSISPAGRTPSPNAQIPEDLQQKHEASVQKYPTLNLSPEEYVITEIKRDGFGLAQIWAMAAVLFIAMFLFVPLMTAGHKVTTATHIMIFVAMGIATVLIALGAMVAGRVYRRNRFFLTNESVIQEAHDSMFAKAEQTVALDSIKDVTYQQASIMASMFNFGTIKLILEGHEADYHFVHVANPKQQCALIHNTVEDFKRHTQR